MRSLIYAPTPASWFLNGQTTVYTQQAKKWSEFWTCGLQMTKHSHTKSYMYSGGYSNNGTETTQGQAP
ncbi:hypothetical protein N7462_000552 [Penicillium macrosclerotiorum]|uniref:uncharacterized protein n=1 Tax=Penicillium macrosclerotiorum TaxID=303699 RepID=UPI0025493E4C|nr:uncharacterized protein N7462_000552 [Penicillium macrosclerotiorum]KAJ5698547.1 hypothetical protein N7462_000552 [Penicillium macrosclerotiorum]